MMYDGIVFVCVSTIYYLSAIGKDIAGIPISTPAPHAYSLSH